MAVHASARGRPGRRRPSLAEFMQQPESGTLHALPARSGGPTRGSGFDEAPAQSMPGLQGNPHGLAAKQASGRDASPLRFHSVPHGHSTHGDGGLKPRRERSPVQKRALPPCHEPPLHQQLPTAHQMLHVPRWSRDVPMNLPITPEGSAVFEDPQQIQRETFFVRQEPNKLQTTLIRPALPCRGDTALQAVNYEVTPVGTSQSEATSTGSAVFLDKSRTKVGGDCHTCAMQLPLQQIARQAQHELTKLSSFRIQVPGLPREGKLGLVLRGTSIVDVNTPWAAQLGFAPGHRLLAINGSPVSDSQDLSRVISDCLAAGPVIFDLGVPRPALLLNQAEAVASRLSTELGATTPASSFYQPAAPNVQRAACAFPELTPVAAVSCGVPAMPLGCGETSPLTSKQRQTSPFRLQAAVVRDSSPTRRLESGSDRQQAFMRGGTADVESLTPVNQHKPSLPNPDQMLQQVLSAAAGVCLSSLPRSDVQRQQCHAMPRAFSPARQEQQDPVVQPFSNMFVAPTKMSTLTNGLLPSKKDGAGACESVNMALPRPDAMQGSCDLTSELLQPTSNSCFSSTVVPPTHVGSVSMEESSVALSDISAKCSTDMGGSGLPSYVMTSVPTPTREATQPAPLLCSGAQLLAGPAADCLPNIGSMEYPISDLPSFSTEVPSQACRHIAWNSPSEPGLAHLPADETTDGGTEPLDAQLEVARMAQQAHRDGWLPQQAQQHVAWMAQQSIHGNPVEAGM